MANDILIVDDEADIRDLVAGILEDEGFNTRTARDSDSALAEIATRRPHLVFLDIWLQGSKLDGRSEEHTSELQSPDHLVCRLLLEKKKHRCKPSLRK